MKSYFHELGLLVMATLFFLAATSFTKPILTKNFNQVAPLKEIQLLSVGLSQQLSDAFWLRSVQDTDYCESLEDDKVCVGKSWFFSVIDLVVDLDPLFSEAYYFGGLSLTVLIKDYPGASIIFDKAIKSFSYEWPILYLAAYHALFQEKNKTKAAKLYLMAANNGAPSWVRLTAGRLASQGGDQEVALDILQQLIKSESNPLWVKKLREQLSEYENKKSAK